MSVTFEDIQRAAQRIRPLAHRTPVMTSRLFDEAAGVQAFFKCENLQRGGSFKIRGAANFVYSIPEADRARGVVAFSSGNHAQAVAIAAEELGIPATIVMPQDAPASKVASTQARGARIVTYDRYRENREAIATALAAETNATIVPPFNHPWIVAGAGTAALELLTDVPDLDAMLVCLGGGGFLSGSCIAAKALLPSIRMFGVEPEAGNDYFLSLQAGEPVGIPTPNTIADGLQTQKPGDVTFPIIREHIESVILVTDEELRATCKFFMTRLKLVVEPSGAAAAAAVLFGKVPAGMRKVGITISGGNVDLESMTGW